MANDGNHYKICRMARIRSSSRGKTAAVAAAARDIDFRHLWRQLYVVGWTAKRPRGIQREWTYVSPDGLETFVGENAVVLFAIESGLLQDIEGNESADGEGGIEAAEDAATEEAQEDAEDAVADDVRPSQIDISAQLSLNTLDELFGASSAVARAFDLSPTNLPLVESDREAATSLNLLSEASVAESEATPEATPGAPADRILRPRKGAKSDVNFVPDNEDLGAYESFSSGDSAAEDFDDGSDGVGCPAAAEDDMDLVSDNDAVEMDEGFVTSFQIGAETMSKSAIQQRAEALRGMQWTPATSLYEENVPAYPGLNMDDAHPTQELRSICHSPLLTFFYFMPKSLWNMIGAETSRYSLQQVDKRARRIFSRQADRRETFVQIRRRLRATPAYQTNEILHVIGFLVARMLCPQKCRFSAHRLMSVDGAIPAGTFGQFMGLSRCTDILRDLHFVDNEAERTRDKLWKLRSIVDKLQQRFLAGWSLPAVFSSDEGVLPSTSKRNTTRMFMPDKPHRYGSKLFMLCDSARCFGLEFSKHCRGHSICFPSSGPQACTKVLPVTDIDRKPRVTFIGSTEQWRARKHLFRGLYELPRMHYIDVSLSAKQRLADLQDSIEKGVIVSDAGALHAVDDAVNSERFGTDITTGESPEVVIQQSTVLQPAMCHGDKVGSVVIDAMINAIGRKMILQWFEEV
ncbi:hypothetical protein L916_13364 [Phytophthora nicotianae]|uniref:PiggyBac transposable element-derived protein domain-containing protein n=1 Tax=Phytophthora nicotianae TaxID=4792 RepID=W2IJI0_PHYNI|nr:hypothetical protein L916_13364 [Phytophthora nicotianae]